MELFNRSLCAPGEEVPREHAERAVRSWHELCKRMGWVDVVAGMVDEGVDMSEDVVVREKSGVKVSSLAEVEEIGISPRL